MSNLPNARQTSIQVGDDRIDYQVEGDASWGTDQVLLAQDDDLSAAAPWHEAGFVVADFIAPDHFATLCLGIRSLVVELLGSDGEGDLDRYHTWVPDEEAHERVARGIQSFVMDRLPIDVAIIEARVSELCGTPVRSLHPTIRPPIWAIRLVRPNHPSDHNPPHRDQWLPYLRGGLNLYVPIAGSTERSSLPVVPGSHLWPESAFAHTGPNPVVNGRQYVVPALVGAARPVEMVRPNPALGQCLVFSPYLMHAGAANLEDDLTRVSLEMRFWRADD